MAGYKIVNLSAGSESEIFTTLQCAERSRSAHVEDNLGKEIEKLYTLWSYIDYLSDDDDEYECAHELELNPKSIDAVARRRLLDNLVICDAE